MSFLIVLVATCLFVAAAAKSIKTMPWLWYAIALALDIAYAYGIVYSLPPTMLQVLSPVVQRCTLATALFVIVMYCGVFSEHSTVRRTVGPIRAELSIIACILAFAHCLNYLSSYLDVLSSNVEAIDGSQLASLVIAIVLFALLLLLGATSLKVLKRRMSASAWKNVQRSSYVFFALIFVHELLILYPAAVKGSEDSLITCVASGVIFVAYFALRFARFRSDRKNHGAQTDSKHIGEEKSGV
ncbi:ferric reductase-like transmembrane domain-containing protein [Paraeggerthella hongkongensis]|uniref:ferric reductase-like transmembrane domain-containing protein n=1 Tax=Paraeggerthella hominis TaxID=2897351 RepID=UPI001C101B56|nr:MULTISPECIES: ferric reductase-like transmembrane domain-containing protein [Paraeggerthella]MBU5405943.1 ferric reductase-like transmembrane domain-containing protein [Paraeggerthella hongkongensis]MCD2433791.1 ferric reductase-like transmembrane domain-containing protein [Paraeggerthella hominis]